MITSALPLALVVATVVALAVTGNLFAWSPSVIAAQAAAVLLNVWARRSFQAGTFRVTAAPGGNSIIRRGPYRVIRHPMYSAVMLFVWAGIISHLSAATLVAGAILTALVITRIVAEERLLRARYPDYADYAGSTKALVPFVY